LQESGPQVLRGSQSEGVGLLKQGRARTLPEVSSAAAAAAAPPRAATRVPVEGSPGQEAATSAFASADHAAEPWATEAAADEIVDEVRKP
jgi:hypothetical protein